MPTSAYLDHQATWSAIIMAVGGKLAAWHSAHDSLPNPDVRGRLADGYKRRQ